MAKSRDAIRMSEAEVAALFAECRSLQVATLGPKGEPHLTTLWYTVHQGNVIFETYGKSQKVMNLRRDPRMSFLVEDGHTYDQLRGVAMEGTGVVIDDPDVVWEVCRNVFERYNGPYSEELRPFVEVMAKNRVAVRLDVDRVRSWDHRKLGLPAMELGGSTAASVE